MDEFLVYFNKRKQWIKVTLFDVHPTTFARWKYGSWGYFDSKWISPKIGFFGDVYLVKSRVREDLVVHELFHVLCEYIWANRDSVTTRNEEKYAALLDELIRNFYREYRKLRNR